MSTHHHLRYLLVGERGKRRKGRGKDECYRGIHHPSGLPHHQREGGRRRGGEGGEVKGEKEVGRGRGRGEKSLPHHQRGGGEGGVVKGEKEEEVGRGRGRGRGEKSLPHHQCYIPLSLCRRQH